MSFSSGILDLLFPPRCAFCRSLLQKGESGMCAACEKKLPYTADGGVKEGEFFSVCVSPLYYEGDVRESILRFKFKEATSYASLYGKLIAACIRENLDGRYDLISWVPLSARRLKKRGYDQAMLLAMAAVTTLAGRDSLNGIKSRTVGDGQYGTARWATDREVKTTYAHVPFQAAAWRGGKGRPTAQGLILGSVGTGKNLTA